MKPIERTVNFAPVDDGLLNDWLECAAWLKPHFEVVVPADISSEPEVQYFRHIAGGEQFPNALLVSV